MSAKATAPGFVFVLGMHRSGTSCLAGALERSGLYLGHALWSGRGNPRGYHEHRPVARLHERILALNGGSWHRPPTAVAVPADHLERIREVVVQLERKRPCGLKDPRLLLILPSWRELVAPPALFVGTFRHPLAVAHSLERIHGLDAGAGIELWSTYNEILVDLHKRAPFALIEFDLSDPEAYCRSVVELARDLGLRPRSSQLRQYVAAELEHYGAAAPVPEECAATYSYLRRNRRVAPPGGASTPERAGERLSGTLHELAFRARRRLAAKLSRGVKVPLE